MILLLSKRRLRAIRDKLKVIPHPPPTLTHTHLLRFYWHLSGIRPRAILSSFGCDLGSPFWCAQIQSKNFFLLFDSLQWKMSRPFAARLRNRKDAGNEKVAGFLSHHVLKFFLLESLVCVWKFTLSCSSYEYLWHASWRSFWRSIWDRLGIVQSRAWEVWSWRTCDDIQTGDVSLKSCFLS